MTVSRADHEQKIAARRSAQVDRTRRINDNLRNALIEHERRNKDAPEQDKDCTETLRRDLERLSGAIDGHDGSVRPIQRKLKSLHRTLDWCDGFVVGVPDDKREISREFKKLVRRHARKIKPALEYEFEKFYPSLANKMLLTGLAILGGCICGVVGGFMLGAGLSEYAADTGASGPAVEGAEQLVWLFLALFAGIVFVLGGPYLCGMGAGEAMEMEEEDEDRFVRISGGIATLFSIVSAAAFLFWWTA